MTVCQAGNHGLAVQIDHARRRRCLTSDGRRRADRCESPVTNRDRFRDRELRVDGDHVTVDEDRVRRLGCLCVDSHADRGRAHVAQAFEARSATRSAALQGCSADNGRPEGLRYT
jgi:hypothetical protein